MQRAFMVLGAICGLTSVAMASLVAHALDGIGLARLELMRTALQVQGWHTAALLACGLWLPRGGRWTLAAGWCFAAGSVLFCGEVYGFGLGWWHVPALAPIGGATLMAGWALLIVAALHRRRD